eukprot:SAG31_NODE_28695_length_406_cov_1.006515_2_plen_92_part_01
MAAALNWYLVRLLNGSVWTCACLCLGKAIYVTRYWPIVSASVASSSTERLVQHDVRLEHLQPNTPQRAAAAAPSRRHRDPEAGSEMELLYEC